MKNKKLIILISVIFAIIFASIIILIYILPKKSSDPAANLESYRQNVDYSESIEKINNPDQGFYQPIYVKASQYGVSFNKNIIDNSTQLYHLRIDISEFSKAVNGVSDILLTEGMLSGLDELFTYIKQQGKNAIARFAYDPSFGGSSNKEPEPQIIYEHIKQVCNILNKYETTITAVEVGLIGPWGEMHTSSIANKTYITPIIETYLSCTNNLPILVRTPKMIYDYLGITISDIENYKIDKSSKAYRLGIYNDGYLGSETDLETYTDREKDISFLCKQTDHLPYGGEVVVPNSKLHDIQNCLPEMFQINLNYLNIKWHNEIINKWDNSNYNNACGNDEIYFGQTAFTYIENHMGYRFVLTDSVFEYSKKFDKLNVKLTLKNVGFGNLNKTKFAKLLFVDENGEVKFCKQVENFSGEQNINYSTELNLDNGKYEVYLCLYGEEVNGLTEYNLQFANKNIWNSTLKANKIGEINIQK